MMRTAHSKHVRGLRVLVALIAAFAFCAVTARAQPPSTHEINPQLSDNASTSICRNGAFLDAVILMNAAMRAHAAMNSAVAGNEHNRSQFAIANAELGAILNVALRQATAEYHCVSENLPLSYAQNYGETLRSAIITGEKLRVNRAVLDQSRAVQRELERKAREASPHR